ncbi:hypothetical protein [Streptomyces sp. NPDC007083]|uniref:hypothetical protein n=1 Tax=unclassified Streptomyces TaxID=2593676 RepID=UPI0033EA415F
MTTVPCTDDGPVYVADSVTALLRLQLAALERGDYTCVAASEELWIDAGLPEDRGDFPHGADSGTDSVDAAAQTPVHHASVTCDAELLPLAGHPTLASVTVLSAEPVSLAPLRDCPSNSQDLWIRILAHWQRTSLHMISS